MVIDQNSKSNETSRFYPRSGLVIHHTTKCVCVCVCARACMCVCVGVCTQMLSFGLQTMLQVAIFKNNRKHKEFLRIVSLPKEGLVMGPSKILFASTLNIKFTRKYFFHQMSITKCPRQVTDQLNFGYFM